MGQGLVSLSSGLITLLAGLLQGRQLRQGLIPLRLGQGDVLDSLNHFLPHASQLFGKVLNDPLGGNELPSSIPGGNNILIPSLLANAVLHRALKGPVPRINLEEDSKGLK